MSSDKKLLSDFATVISGYAFKSEWFGAGNDKVIRIGDLQEGSIQTESALTVDAIQHKISDNFKIQNKDILMALSGATVGKIAVASDGDVGAYINQRVAIIRAKDEITADYLKFFFSGEFLDDLLKNAGGAAQPNLSPKQLLVMEIPFPPLAEQRRIASILDQADELRQKRQQAIEKLDQLLQATFIDMFGDPLTNPKKWEIFKLGELTTKIQSGNTPKGGADNYIEKGITFIRSQNVLKNQMSLDDVVYINDKIHAQMKNSSLKHGDLLITKTGRINTENSSLGRAAIYLGEDDCANLNGHVYLMRLKENLNRIFILSIITSDSYYKYIRSVCVGVDKYQLNKEHLENFPIIQPPMEMQNKFSDIIRVIERQKPKLLEQLQLAEDLFKTLQQKAFSGNL